MSVFRGATFHYQRENDSKPHLWVVTSDCTSSDSVVCVSFTSHKGNGKDDEACVIVIGEHPYVRKRTVVAYWDAQVFVAEDIRDGIKTSGLQTDVTCTPMLLSRITAGFAVTLFAPPECIDILRQQKHLP
jgi:hypothetical protein